MTTSYNYRFNRMYANRAVSVSAALTAVMTIALVAVIVAVIT